MIWKVGTLIRQSVRQSPVDTNVKNFSPDGFVHYINTILEKKPKINSALSLRDKTKLTETLNMSL